MNIFRTVSIVVILITFSEFNLKAQEKEASIEFTFAKEDTLLLCNLLVTSEGVPAPDVSVKLYVKRLFGLLPVGDEATTDENGMASIEFPKDIPGDEKNILEVVAKIEDDENYGTIEASSTVNWGIPKKMVGNISERSLAGSRSNAPIYFIVVSNLIIIGIWGTLLYVVLQVFKIKKLGKAAKKINT